MATRYAPNATQIRGRASATWGTLSRARLLLGSLPGPGILSIVDFSTSSGASVDIGWNIYLYPTLTNELTNDVEISPIDGVPLWDLPIRLRGVTVLPLWGAGLSGIFRLDAPIDPGNWSAYVVAVNNTGMTTSFSLVMTFTPHD